MSPPRTPVTLEQFFDRFVAFEENVNSRFEQVGARFEQVDTRFDRIDLQFKDVAHHIFTLEDTFKQKIARLDVRLTEVNKILEKQAGDLEGLRPE